MDFGIAESRAGMERRFATPSTLAQQLSGLCVVTLVQIDHADSVANIRPGNGGNTGLLILSVDGGLVRWSWSLYFFIACFATQNITHAYGVSCFRDGSDRPRALLDYSYCLLHRDRCSFREHGGLCTIALARRDGFSGSFFFADGYIRQSMESIDDRDWRDLCPVLPILHI